MLKHYQAIVLLPVTNKKGSPKIGLPFEVLMLKKS
jgi:hypothetical protein